MSINIHTKSIRLLVSNTIATSLIAAITSHVAAADNKSTLTYSGYMHGAAHFQSAYCSILKDGSKKSLTASAPVYYKQTYKAGKFTGPKLFLLEGKELLFCPNQYNMSHKNTFKTDSKKQLSKISWKILGDRLTIYFRNVRMFRLVPGIATESPQRNKKYEISLNGTLNCTDDTQDALSFDKRFHKELKNEYQETK